MTEFTDKERFSARVHSQDRPRPGDTRDQYSRDKARVIHSAAFRRLQAKTQVMGIGEGDFHRTRLTHSLEVSQIGAGIVEKLRSQHQSDEEIINWLPPISLIEAACLAHDLGHPPFGHGGEQALHEKMRDHGGFEGNAQTLRILTKLEKYEKKQGLNPTKRTVLAVLKYGVPYSRYEDNNYSLEKPPKCYYDSEEQIIAKSLDPFCPDDVSLFRSMGTKKHKPFPHYMTLDASIMELADDIAFAVHDLEDIVARKLVSKEQVRADLHEFLTNEIKNRYESLDINKNIDGLFSEWSGDRKKSISALVNFFINSSRLERNENFSSPLLGYNVNLDENIRELLSTLNNITHRHVILAASVQQLEVRGQRIVQGLFDELIKAPEKLVPSYAWNDLNFGNTDQRRVCDYIACMTDPYAQRIYQRLFTPGFGSSMDEL